MERKWNVQGGYLVATEIPGRMMLVIDEAGDIFGEFKLEQDGNIENLKPRQLLRVTRTIALRIMEPVSAIRTLAQR